MRFSTAFNIRRTKADDWFDPHMTIDTKLFVDPLLMLHAGKVWADAHEELLQHFVACFGFVAAQTGPTSVSGKAARSMLTFPEPAEFGLGYTAKGTNGAGSGAQFAHMMAGGIQVAISRGLVAPKHIEEVGILNEGIGADRISDAACNVLKHRFITYTQKVARRHGVPLDAHEVRNARVYVQNAKWASDTVLLPSNPFIGKPVILVPRRILNTLPTLNAGDWFDSTMNEDLRMQMNLAIGKKASKADIVRYARQHVDRVEQWAAEQANRTDLHGYDFGDDPKGVDQWDKAPADYARTHPITGLQPPGSQAELSALIGQMLEQFQHFIETQRGWSLLHNADGSEKPEEAAQLVFLGMAQQYLRMFNVEMDREVELGRGPVDFKVSSGARFRILIEVKKAHNGKFWHGLHQQLPSYLASDQSLEGWFVAIRYRDNKGSAKRMNELPGMVARVGDNLGLDLKYAMVDARPKASASQG
jgi:hypothetical protein